MWATAIFIVGISTLAWLNKPPPNRDVGTQTETITHVDSWTQCSAWAWDDAMSLSSGEMTDLFTLEMDPEFYTLESNGKLSV